MQLALWVAFVSIVFQQGDDLYVPNTAGAEIGIFLMLVGVVVYCWSGTRQLGTWVFVTGLLISFAFDWYAAANHTWLAVWTLAPVVLFAAWWHERAYTDYVRYTLGFVMLAAAIQKVVAGTYLNGHYLAWMSNYGSASEQAFGFLCAPGEVCGWYVVVSVASVAWQLLVAGFLLLGWKNLWVIGTEVAFLLAVGLFADEMNFQVLNVTLLCIAFRFAIPIWLAVACLAFLVVDLFGVSYFIERILYAL